MQRVFKKSSKFACWLNVYIMNCKGNVFFCAFVYANVGRLKTECYVPKLEASRLT